MDNTANKAQKYLLDNNCGDLILNDHRTNKPEDRKYASDIMMMFLERALAKNTPTSEEQLAAPDVSKCEGLQGRELLLAYNWFLMNKHNILYWFDQRDADEFLSQQ